jgi:hypothetical protein
MTTMEKGNNTVVVTQSTVLLPCESGTTNTTAVKDTAFHLLHVRLNKEM